MDEQTLALKNQINKDKLPQHVAIIMDGNGRWAKQQGKPRVFGHHEGVKAVRRVTEAAADLGIRYVTLYAFSTENWSRPPIEVTALMTLLVDTMRKEMDDLNKNNIRIQAIGDIAKLPTKTYQALLDGIEKTKNNSRMTLVLALNYSAKWEIVRAAQTVAGNVQNGTMSINDINEKTFASALSTTDMPDPELLIRTSGECRISNFLLWQIAYAELCFMPIYWPQFEDQHLYQAVLDYQNRERRFGKISEQLV
ncbi:MAG: isoprenyl transferase [Saprospiraceae bacterium]|nr:isoprenyl transferase [Saprospiraceae bacterium]MBP7679600.1 isoprenyl transferase [Saprospiraceae bacterium]